jgi:hypothetical protein
MIILKIDTSFIDWMHKDTGGDVESFCIHYYQLLMIANYITKIRTYHHAMIFKILDH